MPRGAMTLVNESWRLLSQVLIQMRRILGIREDLFRGRVLLQPLLHAALPLLEVLLALLLDPLRLLLGLLELRDVDLRNHH